MNRITKVVACKKVITLSTIYFGENGKETAKTKNL
jgi:hypothetical protein